MELNEKEKKILFKFNKMHNSKKIWRFAIIVTLLIAFTYMIIFIDLRKGEYLLMSILCFFISVYISNNLNTAQLLNKLRGEVKGK